MNAEAQVRRSLNALSFPDLVAKPTAVNGSEPKDATDNALTINPSLVDLGFWECSPGSFKTARNGVNEVIFVLEGKGTLVSDTGQRLDHEAGDMVLIPNGWSGVWEIHNTSRSSTSRCPSKPGSSAAQQHKSKFHRPDYRSTGNASNRRKHQCAVTSERKTPQ